MTAPLTRETVLVDAVGGREYRLLRCLGEGGFGSVYLALVRSAGGLEQRVAVKLLHPDTDARSQAVERLRDEARVLASLHHPVILVAHDLVQLSDQIALVTEYVEGQDLGEVMADPVDPIPVGALIDVVGQVAGALDAAWSTAGIVHRDVKPANIRIGRHGNVKLLDFGIAKSGVGPARTQTNVVLGSLIYMAPERFERGRPLSPASDVFALGCVLYEGIAKAQLFNRLDAAKMFGLAMTPRQFDDTVTKRLMRLESTVVRDLLRQMLRRDPAIRISSADLPAACDAVQAALPGRETLRTWCRRHRWPQGGAEDPITSSQPAIADDPLALPPDAPGGSGTTMQYVGWGNGLLQPKPELELPVLPEQPVLTAPTPQKVAPSIERVVPELRVPPPPQRRALPVPVLARTMPPPKGDSGFTSLDDIGTLAPLHPAPPPPQPSPTRWGLVGALVSVMVMAALLVMVGGIAISAIGLLIASNRGSNVEQTAPRPAPVVPAPAKDTPKPTPSKPTPAPVVPSAPAPAPAPVKAAPPKPATPTVKPAPAVEAAPVEEEPQLVVPPEPAFGSVTMSGAWPLELRAGGHVTAPGERVPVGTYEMFVDLGKGWISAGAISVTPGSRAVVSCNSITWVCTH